MAGGGCALEEKKCFVLKEKRKKANGQTQATEFAQMYSLYIAERNPNYDSASLVKKLLQKEANGERPELGTLRSSSFPGAKNIFDGTLTTQGHIADVYMLPQLCPVNRVPHRPPNYSTAHSQWIFFCSFLSLYLLL